MYIIPNAYYDEVEEMHDYMDEFEGFDVDRSSNIVGCVREFISFIIEREKRWNKEKE